MFKKAPKQIAPVHNLVIKILGLLSARKPLSEQIGGHRDTGEVSFLHLHGPSSDLLH